MQKNANRPATDSHAGHGRPLNGSARRVFRCMRGNGRTRGCQHRIIDVDDGRRVWRQQRWTFDRCAARFASEVCFLHAEPRSARHARPVVGWRFFSERAQRCGGDPVFAEGRRPGSFEFCKRGIAAVQEGVGCLLHGCGRRRFRPHTPADRAARRTATQDFGVHAPSRDCEFPGSEQAGWLHGLEFFTLQLTWIRGRCEGVQRTTWSLKGRVAHPPAISLNPSEPDEPGPSVSWVTRSEEVALPSEDGRMRLVSPNRVTDEGELDK
jgi:hypothetical protein